MRKIPTLFKRDFSNNGKITPEYSDGTDWVVRGAGIATRKYDGTSVLVRDGKMYKRFELKSGNEAPSGFEMADHDEVTGKTMGWVPVADGPEDKWHREALSGFLESDGRLRPVLLDGTYELLGPKIQGNPEKLDRHTLKRHAMAEMYFDVPVEFESLRKWLQDKDIEGIVWHHIDGRMVKIKKKDFGLKR